MVQVNSMIGKTLGKDKVAGMALVGKFIQKDDKLVNKGGLMIYKAYFEANVEDVNESSLGNPFCRNYNTIILIKF
jgi:hypothetical protein